MARKFFFVCAGVFLLALSYHLGASRAEAQLGSFVEGANIQSVPGVGFPRATGCVGRMFYWVGENGVTHQLPTPVPGTKHIISTDPYETVMLENGDWLEFNGSGWTLLGNLVGGPVPALRESWGQLKARYRGAPGMTVTPGADTR